MKTHAARSLPISQWPTADRAEWELACRPGVRLRRGGRASHLKPITRDDLARRYGYFLDFLARSQLLNVDIAAGDQVMPANVDAFVAELRARVSSVTLYGSVYKLRRATQLIAPERDVSWLREIENDLALMMKPRSKYDRLVLAEVLVEAGLTLMAEADAAVHLTDFRRARQFRNGLMIALLACCPIRLKNFAALEIGRSFIQNGDDWWIVLAASETKEGRPDERPIPAYLAASIQRYVSQFRLTLGHADKMARALWLSSNDGQPLSYDGIAQIIAITTLSTVGVNVSPHLFRTSAATSSAIHGAMPHLGSAVLHHRGSSVTQRDYNRASSLSAGKHYLDLVGRYRNIG